MFTLKRTFAIVVSLVGSWCLIEGEKNNESNTTNTTYCKQTLLNKRVNDGMNGQLDSTIVIVIESFRHCCGCLSFGRNVTVYTRVLMKLVLSVHVFFHAEVNLPGTKLFR